MRARAKSVQRILNVQKHLHDMAEVKYLEAKQRISQNEKDEVDLINALSGDGALHGLFVDVTVKRLNAVRLERERLMRELDVCAKALLEQGGRMKNAERLLKDLTADVQRDDERKMLDDVVEIALARGAASLKQDG